MSLFTTHIELHGSDDNKDYDKLHEAMAAKGFVRTIDKDGVTYHLPRSEYIFTGSSYTIRAVLSLAEGAAFVAVPNLKRSIVVTKSDGLPEFSGLEKVELSDVDLLKQILAKVKDI